VRETARSRAALVRRTERMSETTKASRNKQQTMKLTQEQKDARTRRVAQYWKDKEARNRAALTGEKSSLDALGSGRERRIAEARGKMLGALAVERAAKIEAERLAQEYWAMKTRYEADCSATERSSATREETNGR
jgi:hypothetical protein